MHWKRRRQERKREKREGGEERGRKRREKEGIHISPSYWRRRKEIVASYDVRGRVTVGRFIAFFLVQGRILSREFFPQSVLGGPGAQAVRDCRRGRRGVVGVSGMGKKPRRSRPPGGILAALRDTSSSPSPEISWGAQGNLWLSPGKVLRRVLQ